MAKRFTDTDKWKKHSFNEMPLKMKLAWIFLCDNCDHAGVWDANFKLMSFHVGEPITKDEFDAAFADKIVWLNKTKIFIQSFIDFQYGELNETNRVHKSIITKLKRYGAYKPLISPLQGAKDKDKDMDKDKDKDQDKEQDKDKDKKSSGRLS